MQNESGYARACHPTADHGPRSARAARRPIKPRQVDRTDGCQGLPLAALEHQDATDLNGRRVRARIIDSVRAELKHLHLEPDPAMLPAELESFSFIARTFIGPPDGPGEESYDAVGYSPQWLAATCREVGLYDARHHLVVDVEQFDERRPAAAGALPGLGPRPVHRESQDHISVYEVTAAPAG
jgi:Immunity protein 8